MSERLKFAEKEGLRLLSQKEVLDMQLARGEIDKKVYDALIESAGSFPDETERIPATLINRPHSEHRGETRR